ncbi:MAG: hypothetical protein QG564_1269 [Campylobacterota bacterium]|nr:hypothetical protein [Campylobacterota bacterium]
MLGWLKIRLKVYNIFQLEIKNLVKGKDDTQKNI